MSDRKQYYYLGSGVSAHRLEQRESTRLAAGQCAEVRGRARTRSEAGGSQVISSSLGLSQRTRGAASLDQSQSRTTRSPTNTRLLLAEAGLTRLLLAEAGLARLTGSQSRLERASVTVTSLPPRRQEVSVSNTSSLTRSQVHSGTRSVKENVVDCDCQQLTLIFLPGRNLCAEGGMV